MVTTGELQSMSAALARYEKYEQSVWAVFYDASPIFDFASYGRMQDIAQSVTDNKARFYSRRDELIEQDPTDHEAILAFVSGINDITGTKMAEAMAAEVKATNVGEFVSRVAQDTVGNVKTYILLAVAALAAVFFLSRR